MDFLLLILLFLVTGLASAVPTANAAVNWNKTALRPSQLSKRAAPSACKPYHAPTATRKSLSDIIMGNKVKENQVSLEDQADSQPPESPKKIEFGLIENYKYTDPESQKKHHAKGCFRVNQEKTHVPGEVVDTFYSPVESDKVRPCKCSITSSKSALKPADLLDKGFTQLVYWFGLEKTKNAVQTGICIWVENRVGQRYKPCNCNPMAVWNKYKEYLAIGWCGIVHPDTPRFLPGLPVPSIPDVDKVIQGVP